MYKAFYWLFIVGLVVFVVIPGLRIAFRALRQPVTDAAKKASDAVETVLRTKVDPVIEERVLPVVRQGAARAIESIERVEPHVGRAFRNARPALRWVAGRVFIASINKRPSLSMET